MELAFAGGWSILHSVLVNIVPEVHTCNVGHALERTGLECGGNCKLQSTRKCEEALIFMKLLISHIASHVMRHLHSEPGIMSSHICS